MHDIAGLRAMLLTMYETGLGPGLLLATGLMSGPGRWRD